MAYGGLRISEVLFLKYDDVNISARQIKVTEGKGEKQRIVIINEKIVNALSSHKAYQYYYGSEYIFCNSKGQQLSRTTINKSFSKYSDCITPHILRHFHEHLLLCIYHNPLYFFGNSDAGMLPTDCLR